MFKKKSKNLTAYKIKFNQLTNNKCSKAFIVYNTVNYLNLKVIKFLITSICFSNLTYVQEM
jgi:hypothetical protein